MKIERVCKFGGLLAVLSLLTYEHIPEIGKVYDKSKQ